MVKYAINMVHHIFTIVQYTITMVHHILTMVHADPPQTDSMSSYARQVQHRPRHSLPYTLCPALGNFNR